MNIRLLSRSAMIALAALALSSCGGSNGDEAGSESAFQVIPNDFTVEGAGGCPGAVSKTMFIYGGVAPYRINSTSPALTVDKSTVGDRGGSFTLTTVAGSCVDPATIVVVDKLEHTLTVLVHLKAGAAPTP
jgi:hypothetical protein